MIADASIPMIRTIGAAAETQIAHVVAGLDTARSQRDRQRDSNDSGHQH